MIQSPSRLPPDILRHIVEAGIRAPSADNGQPWRLVFDDGRLTIVHDRSRALRFDTAYVASRVAIGAMIENIVLAAGRVGVATRVNYVQDSRIDDVASVEFAQNGAHADDLAGYIDRRGTNRGPYATRPLTAREHGALQEATDAVSGVRLLFLDGSRRARCARLVMAADRFRYRQRALHEELMKAIRWAESERSTDGLQLKALGLGRSGEMLLRAIRRWSVAQTLHWLGLAHVMAAHSYMSVMRSAAVAIVHVDMPGPVAPVLLGRAMQRLWLAATKLGLSAQPLSLGTLLWLHLPVAAEAALRPLRDSLEALVGQRIGQSPLVVLRIGEAHAPTASSGRRRVEDVLTIGP